MTERLDDLPSSPGVRVKNVVSDAAYSLRPHELGRFAGAVPMLFSEDSAEFLFSAVQSWTLLEIETGWTISAYL